MVFFPLDPRKINPIKKSNEKRKLHFEIALFPLRELNICVHKGVVL